MSEPLTPAGLRLAHWLANRGLDDGDIREAIREAEAEARAAVLREVRAEIVGSWQTRVLAAIDRRLEAEP